MRTDIFVRFCTLLSISFSFSLVSLGTHSVPLSSSLFLRRYPAFLLLFFSYKREWDKLVNLYANGFNLMADRGVTTVLTARLRRGSRGDGGKSPKISRSGSAVVCRPVKNDLYDSRSSRTTSVSNCSSTGFMISCQCL